MKKPLPPLKPKRDDLQGIRGIAIISVLSFHFLPTYFPNGYVGVDQFFVLSGFLMCMLLRKSDCSSLWEWTSNFYIRRLKRIVPLYFLVILMAISMVLTVFPYVAVDANVNYAKKALVFVSNRVATDDEDYFKMLSLAVDVFTHTWSLSVEVQFYLIVPFLYLLGAKIAQNYSDKLELPYYLIIASLSFLYSTFLCTEQEAFNSVPARIWQFSIGMMAFLLSSSKDTSYTLLPEQEEKEEVEEIEKTTNYNINYKPFLVFLIIFLAIYPKELPYLRPFMTVLTGILMVFPTNFLLESKFLTYSGDISYSLYLIHWPVYAFWKLTMSDDEEWNKEWVMAIGASVLLAVICHETFEKWYLKQSNQFLFILSLILFSSNIGLLYQKEISNWISPPEITHRLDGLKDGEVVSYEKAIKLNTAWNYGDQSNIYAPSCEGGRVMAQYCSHTGLDTKNGKYKMMILGNSWAGSHARLFYEECAYQANTIIEQWKGGCEPLFPWHQYPQRCIDAFKIFESLVEKHKPDYLFLFSRFMNIGDPLPPNGTDLNEDPIYQLMKKKLELYSKNVKIKIYIMDQIARFSSKGDKIPQALKEGRDLVEFDKSLVSAYPDRARLRYAKLASECSKCELFDYKPKFFNTTTHTWRFYDEANAGLAYVTTGTHLTFHGLELVRPIIKDLCAKL